MRRLMSTLVLLLLVVGCAAPAEPPAEPATPQIDLAAEREALMQADRSWAADYAASDDRAAAFTNLMLDDAYLLPPDAPIAHGKEEIGGVVAMLEGMPGFSITWEPTTAKVGQAGDLGYTIGTYEMAMEGPDGSPMTIVGKYLTVWEKQPDGSWKVTADMFNADAPPAPGE